MDGEIDNRWVGEGGGGRRKGCKSVAGWWRDRRGNRCSQVREEHTQPRLDTQTNVIITHVPTVCAISLPRLSPLSLFTEGRLCSRVLEK